jgi:hypothetical protein
VSRFFESTPPLSQATGAEDTSPSRIVFPISEEVFERLEFPEKPWRRSGPQNKCEIARFSDRRFSRFPFLLEAVMDRDASSLRNSVRLLTSEPKRWEPPS